MSPVTPNYPKVGTRQLDLLEKLSNAVAVSGDEGEVRAIVLAEIKSVADDIREDALGNILAIRKTRTKDAPKVMVAAHMDEIGFMLVESEEGGLYKFELVGGIDHRSLPGKPVLVGKDHLPGVIGAKPIHLTTAGEYKNVIPLDTLRIDLGLGKNLKVELGDRAAFATRFQQNGNVLLGKALDDRLGVASLIELFKHAPENIEFQAAFTVQEEIGLRGAKVAAYSFNPDMAFVIDSTPAFDMPISDGSENTLYNTQLGAGPAIYIADAGTLSDPRLIRLLVHTADSNSIPYQFRQPGGGGTDAGSIHKSRGGIPSVSISIPGRYAHTSVLVASLKDWQNTLKLVYLVLLSLSKDTLEKFNTPTKNA